MFYRWLFTALFVLMWAASYAIWRTRRIEERWGARLAPSSARASS